MLRLREEMILSDSKIELSAARNRSSPTLPLDDSSAKHGRSARQATRLRESGRGTGGGVRFALMSDILLLTSTPPWPSSTRLQFCRRPARFFPIFPLTTPGTYDSL